MAGPRVPAARALGIAVYAAVITSGVVVIGAAAWSTRGFVPGSSPEFWVLAVVAVVAELSPFTIPHARSASTRLLVSLCMTFAIFLVWGPAPAILSQSAAVTVAGLRQRRPTHEWLFTMARCALAFAAAGVVDRMVGRAPTTLGVAITRFDLYGMVPAVLAWLVVNYGLIAIVAYLAGPDPRWRKLGPTLGYDLVGTVVLMCISPVLVTAPAGLTNVVLILPLLVISQLSRLLIAQEFRLRRDPLTGLANARGLATAADALAAVIPRLSAYSLLLIRIPGFSDIRTRLGAEAADLVLIEVAGRLAPLAGNGTAARIHWTDFALLIGSDDRADVDRATAAVIEAFATPVEASGLPFKVSPAIGVATSHHPLEEFSAVMARAEAAVTDAFEHGAQVSIAANASPGQALQRLRMLTDLRAAITQPERAAEIALAYQPQIAVDSGEVVGVEALVRWVHPIRGAINTGELIKAAESSAIMQMLTIRIINDAAAQVASWSRQGLVLRASVNVSAYDLNAPGFADAVRIALARHSVPPGLVDLEITESAFTEDSAELTSTVHELAALGVGLSLDDFGTGFASLRQLRRFPLTEVKIDRSYITTLTTDDTDRAIVRAVCDLSRALRLRVVAEGVEDQATVDELVAIGGIVGQGFHLGRPMSPDGLVAWIRSRPGWPGH